jgi:hypothetical protein
MTLDIYLDVSSGNTINLDVTGQPAGKGFLNEIKNYGVNVVKYVYRVTLTRGDGAVTAIISESNPSVGSDPHITTIFGKKFDFHPSTRKDYTLLKTKELKIISHFSPFKNGIFYDRVNIELSNNDKIDINFNKQRVKGKSEFIEITEKSDLFVKYQNTTHDKSIGKFFNPKKLTKISYKGNTPMDLFIDYQTRYVHFRFPSILPRVDEMSGLIAGLD